MNVLVTELHKCSGFQVVGSMGYNYVTNQVNVKTCLAWP
jgi:hypothetical protein